MMTRKRMQRPTLSFAVIFLITFIFGMVVSGPSTPLRRRVRHQNIKVRITATGDTIVLKYLLPNAHTKLEGYILGYGSRMFSKQFIQLPENGLPFVKEFDAEAKYLITVKPIQINEVKKYCKGKVELEKPLSLVVGPVTPSSVLLSWGDTLKNPYTGNILKECLEEGHYTVRYREKDKKWSYQTCPTSDTVIDNLKPNAVYEFGVKPISKEGSGEWSNPVVHNTSNVKSTEKPIKTIVKHPINPVKPLGPGPHSSPFSSSQGGEDFSRSILPLNIKPTMASLPVSHAYMAKCEEHHHKQPQEIPKSKQHSQHLPKQKQHPKHTPLNDSHKQFPSTPLPQKHYPKKLLPDTDLYPKFNLAHFTTPQTKPQTKPQPTLQPQSQMSVQPVNQPSDPKLVTNSHLRFQPTRKPLQSHNLAPEQPHLQPAPNLILQTSPQTLQPNSPAHSQPELISQTAPSNNVQPIHPKFQAQPRMPKPPSLSTSKPITQTQSEDQQRSKPKHHNKLQPEPQPWTQQQFHESKAQPQPVTDSIFQTQKQTIFLPTTETQKQHWPTAKEETQTHLNKILLPQTEDKKQPQTTNKLTTQTKQPPQLTLSPMASNEHQVQWQPTLEPLVQIKPVSQPISTAPLPPKSASQNQLQNREQHRTEPPLQFQFTSEPKVQAEKQTEATSQAKSQTEQRQLYPPSKLKTQKKPYPQAPTTWQKPQPTNKPTFHTHPPPQPTLLSNIQNDLYPESQPPYVPKSHPQEYPQSQPTIESIHQTQTQLYQTSEVNLQTELFPQSRPESQFHHQPQQPQSTINPTPHTQEISQPTYPAKHQNEPTSYQQSQKTIQVQTHPYPLQTHLTVMPTLNNQPEVETTVQDKSKLQNFESEFIFHSKPPLQPKVQMQPSQQSQLPPEQPHIHSTMIPIPKNQTPPNSASPVKPKNDFYPKTQPPFQDMHNPQQPHSLTVPHPKPHNENVKTPQQSWNEFHSPLQPTSQVIPISNNKKQFQPILETTVQSEPYKQSQPLPQPQIHSTSIPILLKKTITKPALPGKPKNAPYPQSQPPFHAIPNTQQHPQPSPPESKPLNESQAELHLHEHKATAIPTFLTQSQPTLHIQPHNKSYPESKPLVQTTLYLQEPPQLKSTLKPSLQTDPQPQSTSEFKPHNKFHSQSQLTFPSISQPRQSISTPRPMHQPKIPAQAASQPTPKSEPPPQLKQTFQDKHQAKHQHYQPQTTPSHQSKPRNGPQTQHQQLFHLEAHTQKQPQLSVTLDPILQSKLPTYQTQTPLQLHSQTQYSQYQATSQPSQTKHSPVYTHLFQIQAHSTPHPSLQMQSQTQPRNKPILQTRLQESMSQSTHHFQPETKQQSLSHPTSQSLHQHMLQQTTQPTNQIPNQQAFQPTHRNPLENQSKSELNLQKKSQTQQQEPTHSEPPMPKKPPKKANGGKSKKPKVYPRPPTKSQSPTEMQQPKPTPIFHRKPQPQPQPQSHPASQHHPWTKEQKKTESTSKPLLQTQQQNLQFRFHSQTYTTLQPKVWITKGTKNKTKRKPKPQPNFNAPQKESKPTFSPKLQKQPKPTLRPVGQTPSQFTKRPKFKPWGNIKKLRSTTPLPISQIQTQTQTHSKTKTTTEPEAEKKVQITWQPNVYFHKTVLSASILPKQLQLQPTSQPVPESQSFSQPRPGSTPIAKLQTASQPIPQTQPQLQPTSQPVPESQSFSQLYPRSTPIAKIQTASQPIPQTQPQLPPTSQPVPESQSLSQHYPRSTPIAKMQTASQPIPQTQPQLPPTSQPVPESQSFSQPQPRSTIKTQTTSKPVLQTQQPQHKLTSHPKLHVQETTLLSAERQTRASAERASHPMTDSQSIPLPHLPSQTHSQTTTVLKQHSTTWPQVQPQPGLQTESQTRTYTDPTRITPGQTFFMAPSPPEEGKPLPRPELATENAGAGVQSGLKDEAPHSPVSSSAPPTQRNAPLFYPQVPQRPSRPISTSKTFINSRITSTTKATGLHQSDNDLLSPVKSEEKPSKDSQDKPRDPRPKDNKASVMKRPAVTPRPRQERRQGTTTAAPAVNSTNFNISENSTIFSSLPTSDVDATGKKRYIAPHVIYKTDKRPEEPCSITSSLSYFPDEEANDLNVTSPPRIPPSNLTVVTVEGCPSFVILDWQKSDNETTEYEIHSTTKGERGVEKSVVTTNQTHTAVENLKPESNYEFTVTPKNELGAGPPTDPVSFSTESADPRVSEYVSGKNSIWSDFPFQSTDAAYSECHGRMFVKRTWYRKFVGIQLCNSLRYQIYLSDSLNGKFYNIGDLTGQGEDHCQFVDSFLDGNTGSQVPVNELPKRPGFYRAMRHEPVTFGEVGGNSRATYVGWYECGTPIPGKW